MSYLHVLDTRNGHTGYRSVRLNPPLARPSCPFAKGPAMGSVCPAGPGLLGGAARTASFREDRWAVDGEETHRAEGRKR